MCPRRSGRPSGTGSPGPLLAPENVALGLVRGGRVQLEAAVKERTEAQRSSPQGGDKSGGFS